MNPLTPYEVAGLDRLLDDLDALEQTPAPTPVEPSELGEEEEPERWDGLG